jgi:WD40 repeat protein
MKTTEESSFSVGSKEYSGRSASPPLDSSSNRTVRFDDESAKSGSKSPLGPETPTATNHRHGQTGHQPSGIGGIHLKRSNTANDEQDKVHGFVDGNFASGKIRDLPVSGCYIVGYLANTNLLAVGLTDSLDFYETGNYSLIQSVERSDTVSAIKWLPQAGNCSLLAVAGLDGVVSIYRMDIELLEMNAPALMHEFRVNGQVRALDCAFCGKLDRSLVVAVGDKMGRVTFASYREDLEHIDTQAVEQQPMGILGLSICALKGIIAISTKAGHVIVHGLRREYSGAVRIDIELWSMHRSGPIRSIIFSTDGTQMALGGYDSTLVLVNVELWKVNRELLLQGTVSRWPTRHLLRQALKPLTRILFLPR